ncbi:MAG: Phage T7 exclusion protein, partial [uncultured Acetobacteraceae bacterium]
VARQRNSARLAELLRRRRHGRSDHRPGAGPPDLHRSVGRLGHRRGVVAGTGRRGAL